MANYKNIRVKKPNGGYRTQRVQVLASGKYKFVKNKPTSRSTKARRRTVRAAPKARRRTYVARRRKRGGSRRKGIRIAAALGMVAGVGLSAKYIWDGPDMTSKAYRTVQCLTGYNLGNKTWDYTKMYFTLPAVAGAGVSMVASKAGLNRYTPKGINI